MNVLARALTLCTVLIAASAASAASLTEASIEDMLNTMDHAIQNRSAEGVGKLLSNSFKMTLEMTAYGQKQVMNTNRDEYLDMLREAWAGVTGYKYERTNVKITMLPGGTSAKVTAQVLETVTVQGQSLTTVSAETATVQLIDGRVLVTEVFARSSTP